MRSFRSSARVWLDGVVISDVARRHGLKPQQLFGWRSQFKARAAQLLEQQAPAFAPAIVDDTGVATGQPAQSPEHSSEAFPSIEVTVGRARIVIRGAVDQRTLADCAESVEGAGVIVPQSGVRVLVATRPVDFRKGIDGLAALVQEHLRLDPFTGTVFVFRAKRADRVKLLVWDGNGLVMIYKRLDARQVPLASDRRWRDAPVTGTTLSAT